MLDAKVVELLNQQVNKEFYSAYLYLDFSDYYYDEGPGSRESMESFWISAIY